MQSGIDLIKSISYFMDPHIQKRNMFHHFIMKQCAIEKGKKSLQQTQIV